MRKSLVLAAALFDDQLKSMKEEMGKSSAEQVKECKDKGYGQDCLTCIAAATDEKSMDVCESKCKTVKPEEKQ